MISQSRQTFAKTLLCCLLTASFAPPLTEVNGFSISRKSPRRHLQVNGNRRHDRHPSTAHPLRLNMIVKPPTEEEKTATFDPFGLKSKQLSPLEDMELSELPPEDDNSLGIWMARGLLLVVAVLFGTNFASVKYLETLCFHPPCNHPPSEAALARFGVAAIISLPILFGKQKEIIMAGLECGALIALGYFTQALALETVPSGECAFICSLTVVIVPLISYLFYGKELKTSNVISAALALSGVAILEGLFDFKEILGIQAAVADVNVDSASIVEAANTGWLGLSKGDYLALGQPVGFGLSFMRIEHYVEKFKDTPNKVLTLSAAQCVSVGILSLGWVLLDFHGTIPNMEYMIEPHRIGAIAWTGIMTTIVAIYLEGFALQVATASDAALIFASEPVWASLFGAWLLHERLDVNDYFGGAVILSACVVGAVADFKSEARNDDEEELEKS